MDLYNNICDLTTFLNSFPKFELIEVHETPQYLIKALFDDYNTRKLAETFNKIRTLLIDGKVSEAMTLYQTAQEGLSSGVSLQCVDIVKDTSRYDDYVERTKDFNKYYISTGFKELDSIVGGFDREEELATIVARTNVGKCLAKGTKILMADGTTKNVEDVQVGDKVQSLNRINNVLALHNGISNGYRICPMVGEPFIVSSNHILTIMMEKEVWDSKSKRMVTKNDWELKDMMIEDYLKLSNHKKHICKLYRPSIEYGEKDLKIPPYILGLWLGDGTARGVSLSTIDDEILNEWNNYAINNGLHLTANRQKTTKCATYSIVGKKGIKNVVTENFKEYNLLNNKHIPLEYLTGSREQRLELLAGILDTDGYLYGSTYSIVQKSENLTRQLMQLCRGLGLKVSKLGIKHNKTYDKDYYQFSISGPTYNIPCRLPRKINVNKNVKQDNFILTGFRVEPVDYVEYYGFMCDGDERYMLSDNTLTHNTWLLLKCALSAAQQGLRVGIYSGEMSERKVGYRIDTLLGHISNGSITHGNDNVLLDYKRYIDELPSLLKGSIKVLTPKMINGPADVNSLRVFIEKENLQALFVDQFSLLEDQRKGKSPTEKMSNISKDLKNLQVLKRIPIISVSQQNRTVVEDGANTTQIAQSDRIGQDSTMIIFMEKKDTLIKLILVKSRDSENSKTLSYVVDFNLGTFTYVPDETSEVSQEVSSVDEYKTRYDVVESEEDVF